MIDENISPSGMQLLEAIAALEARLGELAAEARPLREQMSRNDKERARLQSEKERLESLLASRRDDITVSDHAVVRYLERRYGFDFEAVRDEILTPAVRSAVNSGAAAVKVAEGMFRIKGRTIVTFVTGGGERKR